MLCRSYVSSGSRTGLRVIKQLDGKPSKNLPKILVTEPTGHNDLLDFLSVYQTQDHFKGKHYHPKGALCFYSCNKYGEPTGEVIYARKVPIESLMFAYSLKRKFRMKGFEKSIELKDLFQSEIGYEDYKTVKPVLYQPPIRRRAQAGKTKKGKE